MALKRRRSASGQPCWPAILAADVVATRMAGAAPVAVDRARRRTRAGRVSARARLRYREARGGASAPPRARVGAGGRRGGGGDRAEGGVNRRTALALLGLCIGLRAVSRVRPSLSEDEAIYAPVAREMLTGHELYRDIVDHKPPAVYLVYAATQAIAGPTGGMVLLHALLIGVVFATGLVLARIVRLHWPGTDARAPPPPALSWIAYTTTLVDVDALAANCELFMMLPLVGAVAVFLEARGRIGDHVLAGALIGAACLFKYQAGIQLPLFAVAALLGFGEGRLGSRLAGVVAIGVGFAATIGFAACWLWRGGGFDAALFWFKFNFAYIEAGTSWGELVRRLAIRGGLVVGSAALLYGLGMAAVVAARREPFVRFMTGWVLVSGLAVFVGGRFFGHYFHQLTAPLAVLAAPATVRLWQRRRALVAAAIAEIGRGARRGRGE